MYLLSDGVTLQKPEVGTAQPLLPNETLCTLLRPTFVGLKAKLKIKSQINRGHYVLMAALLQQMRKGYIFFESMNIIPQPLLKV